MKMTTEEVTTRSKIIFIYDKDYPIIRLLKQRLENYQFDIKSATSLANLPDDIKYCFIFNQSQSIEKILDSGYKGAFFIILFNNPKKLHELSVKIEKRHLKEIKLINIDQNTYDSETQEKILWFIFSASPEKSLNLERGIKSPPKRSAKKFRLDFRIEKKKLILFFFLTLFFLESFFIFPLLATHLVLYKGTRELSDFKIKKAKGYQATAEPLLWIAHKSYNFSRPALSFLSLSLLPDNLLSLSDAEYSFVKSGIQTQENGQKVISLILKRDITENERNELVARIEKLKLQTSDLSRQLTLISQKLNFGNKKIADIKKQVDMGIEGLNQASKVLSHAKNLIGGPEEKKYLLLFQNNMEIRPGGGFIGSFGTLSFANYTLADLKIEDVYVADGQLKDHIDPPDAIRKYLNQPNLFLRDSNFSPDGPTNFEKAFFFLEKELDLKNFDGAISFTTTSISNILDAFGDIYVPDYDEVVNHDNFYIKAQTHSEKDFFAGSTQKKNFLSSLVRSLMINLENTSFRDLGGAIKKSLDEKQIVLYVNDENIKKDINSFGWDGKVVIPSCAPKIENCISDNFFAYDANLGINKANFFVSRILDFKVRVKDDGEIENTLTIDFTNNSETDVFPGGIYKNYFQIYLPTASKILEVTKNRSLVSDYQEDQDLRFKLLSYYFEVAPKSKTQIKIKYVLKDKILKGKNTYQLIIQKQIGALNNDLRLALELPPQVHVVNQNFTAIANSAGLVYNTSLSTDRIFFIELLRE